MFIPITGFIVFRHSNTIFPFFVVIKVLTKLEDYHVWAKRLEAAIVSGSLWGKQGPFSTSIFNNVMLNLIDDYFVDQILDSDCSATTLSGSISQVYTLPSRIFVDIYLTRSLTSDNLHMNLPI